MRHFGLHMFRSNADSGDGPEPAPRPRIKVGLALGAGSARGWCHIGVLRELEKLGIQPDVIVGTSIGAVVGGCQAAGRLDALESFATGLTRTRVFSMLDWSFSGRGLISGGRLREQLDAGLAGLRVENLPIRFAAVATEAGSGHEVWLTRGSLTDAIRASYALPGIFEPVQIEKRWLIDGAIVNPVPVNVCRALGADIVIAVNVIEGGRPISAMRADQLLPEPQSDEPEEAARRGGFLAAVRGRADGLRAMFRRRADGGPSMASVMMDAFNITQDRVARSRLAGDPPDVFIRARLDGIGMFEFHRAAELIESGREAVRRSKPDLEFAGLIESVAQ